MSKIYNKTNLSFVLICCCIVSILSFNMNIKAGTLSNNDKRACWISFLDMETYLRDLSKEEFTVKISEMYDLINQYGMNTVIVHVRAMGDSMYPSDFFPLSVYIASDRSIEYDPLEIMVEIAHEKGLFFEAWINPYRLSKNNITTESFKTTEYYELYKSFTIEYEDSSEEICLSLDPSKDETNKLICNQIREIIENYNVDGIHFDDYFYMPGMVDGLDESTKKAYVNNMVKQVHDTVKALDETITFGISPAGNTDSARSQGADIDTWLSQEGYVDYIMPQIYWSDSYMVDDTVTTLYTDRCKEWMSLNLIDIPIYSGLALYRVGEDSDTDLGWSESDDNLMRQYEKAYNMGYDGYALFRYAWLELEISLPELNNLSSYCTTITDGGVYTSENVEIAEDSDVEENQADTEEEVTEEKVEEVFHHQYVTNDRFMMLYLSDDNSDFWNIMSHGSYCNIIAYNIHEDIYR